MQNIEGNVPQVMLLQISRVFLATADCSKFFCTPAHGLRGDTPEADQYNGTSFKIPAGGASRYWILAANAFADAGGYAAAIDRLQRQSVEPVPLAELDCYARSILDKARWTCTEAFAQGTLIDLCQAMLLRLQRGASMPGSLPSAQCELLTVANTVHEMIVAVTDKAESRFGGVKTHAFKRMVLQHHLTMAHLQLTHGAPDVQVLGAQRLVSRLTGGDGGVEARRQACSFIATSGILESMIETISALGGAAGAANDNVDTQQPDEQGADTPFSEEEEEEGEQPPPEEEGGEEAVGGDTPPVPVGHGAQPAAPSALLKSLPAVGADGVAVSADTWSSLLSAAQAASSATLSMHSFQLVRDVSMVLPAAAIEQLVADPLALQTTLDVLKLQASTPTSGGDAAPDSVPLALTSALEDVLSCLLREGMLSSAHLHALAGTVAALKGQHAALHRRMCRVVLGLEGAMPAFVPHLLAHKTLLACVLGVPMPEGVLEGGGAGSAAPGGEGGGGAPPLPALQAAMETVQLISSGTLGADNVRLLHGVARAMQGEEVAQGGSAPPASVGQLRVTLQHYLQHM